MEPHMIHAELATAKRIRVLETNLLKLYIQAGDKRALTSIVDVIEAAMNEGALSERHKDFNEEGN